MLEASSQAVLSAQQEEEKLWERSRLAALMARFHEHRLTDLCQSLEVLLWAVAVLSTHVKVGHFRTALADAQMTA